MAHGRIFLAAVLSAASLSGLALAAPAPKAKEPEKPKAAAVKKPKAGSLAPLPASEKVEWSHGPFEAGDCSLCHKGKDPKNPGPIVKATNELWAVGAHGFVIRWAGGPSWTVVPSGTTHDLRSVWSRGRNDA